MKTENVAGCASYCLRSTEAPSPPLKGLQLTINYQMLKMTYCLAIFFASSHFLELVECQTTRIKEARQFWWFLGIFKILFNFVLHWIAREVLKQPNTVFAYLFLIYGREDRITNLWVWIKIKNKKNCLMMIKEELWSMRKVFWNILSQWAIISAHKA